MKAVVFREVETLALEEVAEPCIREPRDAIVEVGVAGLCGSDLHPYFGRERGLDPGTIMGHEFVGIVREVGPEAAARGLEVGDRVVSPFTTNCGDCRPCRDGLTARCLRGELFGWVQEGRGLHGAQAELVRVPLADSTLVAVPDTLADDAVALLAGDILSTALFGAEIAGVREGELVAVVGCGPVGLLAIRAALAAGAREVIAVDGVPTRLAMAGEFGAVAVDFHEVDPAEVAAAHGDGHGVDAVIEAVGTPEATRTAGAMVRAGGRIGAVGVHVEPHLALSPVELYDRNLTYAAGRCPARRLAPAALELAVRDTELLARLITHRLPLDRAVEAYRRFGAREPGWGKVVFELHA